MGKYCVRFGCHIKQFCSNVCLEDHKKALKVRQAFSIWGDVQKGGGALPFLEARLQVGMNFTQPCTQITML